MAKNTKLRSFLLHTLSTLASPKAHGVAGPPLPAVFSTARGMFSSTLFVAGLSFTTDEKSLEEAFSSHGEVTAVRVIKNRVTGASRGYGFVTFSSKAYAEAALQGMDGQILGGRTIKVDYVIDNSTSIPPISDLDGVFSGSLQSRHQSSEASSQCEKGSYSQRRSGFSPNNSDFFGRAISAQRDPGVLGGSGPSLSNPGLLGSPGSAQKDSGFQVGPHFAQRNPFSHPHPEFAQQVPRSPGSSGFAQGDPEFSGGPSYSQEDLGCDGGPLYSQVDLGCDGGPSCAERDHGFPASYGSLQADSGFAHRDPGFSGGSRVEHGVPESPDGPTVTQSGDPRFSGTGTSKSARDEPYFQDGPGSTQMDHGLSKDGPGFSRVGRGGPPDTLGGNS